jgi:outer membrane immunogenic protein
LENRAISNPFGRVTQKPRRTAKRLNCPFFACYPKGEGLLSHPEYGLGRIHGGEHMKKLLVAGISAAALCGAPALAADIPTKAPAPAYVGKGPVAAPIFNWTGFYVGIEGGGGWGSTKHTNANNGISSSRDNISGGLFGATYGYNWQSGPWVLGLEGDISWSGIKDTFNSNNGAFCTAPIVCVTNLRWLGTDRARFGYAWDRLLVYGTVGVAYGDVKGNIVGAPGFPVGHSTRSGLIFGGGVEWAFAPNWSAKAEYLRTDLGDKITYIGIEKISLKDVDIVRVGINYKFGDVGKGPVYAKY